MRRFLAFLIGREFAVELARDGLEGIEKARKHPPDLILTDVMMPELSGTELCRAIKENPELRHIPVVLLTSKSEPEMKIQGLEMGADDYVTKPFHPREIMARIRSLVRLRSLQEDLEVNNRRLSDTNADLANTLNDLKEAESALVQAERLAAVGELAAGIAHEVNNPVNFATNALRALEAYVEDIRSVVRKVQAIDWSDDSVAQEMISDVKELQSDLRFGDIADSLSELVAIVTEGLDRTQRLVSELKNFASPGAGEIGWIDVTRGLQSTIQLIRYVVQERNVAVHRRFRNDLPEIKGDGRALNQVFLNLLKNACDSVGESGGNVWVSTDVADEGVVVRIRDDGSGIAAEDLDQLFEPFFSTKAPGRGTGLGLSISRRIVSEHGGVITVESELGIGSTFVVWLPTASG